VVSALFWGLKGRGMYLTLASFRMASSLASLISRIGRWVTYSGQRLLGGSGKPFHLRTRSLVGGKVKGTFLRRMLAVGRGSGGTV